MAWILVLIVVVFIHELGHFLVARWCGVTVSTFSIGFGREIAGFTDKHGTRWKFGWLPLGGYVKFMDDENAASVPSHDKLKEMSEAQRSGAFQLKPLWQRAAVVVAGPMANFLSAILMFAAAMYFAGSIVVPAEIKVKPLNPAILGGLKTGDLVTRVDGKPVASYKDLVAAIGLAPGREISLDIMREGAASTLKVTPDTQKILNDACHDESRGVMGIEPAGDSTPMSEGRATAAAVKVRPHYAAVQAGLLTGDVVTAIDGKPIKDFQELSATIARSAGKELTFAVARNGAPVSIKVMPDRQTVSDGFGGTDVRGIVGIEAGADRTKLPVTYASLPAALVAGVTQTWSIAATTLGAIPGMFQSRESAAKLGGLPTIIDISNQIAKCSPEALLPWIGLISVSIGLLNLFPIPLLDGGHLMYYAAEAVMGRPLSARTQEFGFRIGLALVSSLMVFALWNDRFRMLEWINRLLERFS